MPNAIADQAAVVASCAHQKLRGADWTLSAMVTLEGQTTRQHGALLLARAAPPPTDRVLSFAESGAPFTELR